MDFTFCGVSVADCGLHYVPKADNIFVWDSNYETHSVEVAGHHGGYYFGSTIKPKAFDLDCYFEDITSLQLKQIQALFHRGRTGELVFSDRPFLTYTATVTEWTRPEIYATKSGLITLHLTAFYPFARMDRYSVLDFEEYGSTYEDLVKGSTGVMLTSDTPANVIDTTTALTAVTSFLLYSCGDERADPVIRIAGSVGTGVSIYNSATKQTCAIKGLTKALTSNVNKWLEIDTLSGKVYLTDGTTPVMSFLYHDRGFIQLEGSAPIRRSVPFTYTGNALASDALFTPNDEEKYVNISGTWRRITDYMNPSAVLIDYTYGAPGSATSDIVTMNYITVTPVTTMEITKLEFHYNPTFK